MQSLSNGLHQLAPTVFHPKKVWVSALTARLASDRKRALRTRYGVNPYLVLLRDAGPAGGFAPRRTRPPPGWRRTRGAAQGGVESTCLALPAVSLPNDLHGTEPVEHEPRLHAHGPGGHRSGGVEPFTVSTPCAYTASPAMGDCTRAMDF